MSPQAEQGSVDVNELYRLSEFAPVHPWEDALGQHALCRGSTEMFLDLHALTAGGRESGRLQLVRETCAQCPVRVLCREVCDYLETYDGHTRFQDWSGVWAGELPSERRERRKREQEEQSRRPLAA